MYEIRVHARAGLHVVDNEPKLALVIVLTRERISSVAPAYEPLNEAHRHRHHHQQQHQHPAAPSDADSPEDTESASALEAAEAEAPSESELHTSAIPVLSSSSRSPNPATASTHRESSSAASIAVGAAATADATEMDVEMEAEEEEEEETLHLRQDSEDRPAGVSSEPAVPRATPPTTRDPEVVREQAISTMSNLAMAILKSIKGSASTDKASSKPVANSASVPETTSAHSAPADVDLRGASSSSLARSSSTSAANAEAVVAQYVRSLVSQQLSTSASNLGASPSASAGARNSTLPPAASESAYATPKRMAFSPSLSSSAGGTLEVKTLRSTADSIPPLAEQKQRHGSSRWDQRVDADIEHSSSGGTLIPVLLKSGVKRTALQDESEWPADSHSPETPTVKAARQESVRTPLLPPAPASASPTSLVSPPLASPSLAGGSPMLPRDFSSALPPPGFMQLASGPQWAGPSVPPSPSHPIPFPIANFGVQTAALSPIVPLVHPASGPPPRLPPFPTATSPTPSATALSPTSGVSFTIHPTRLQWL